MLPKDSKHFIQPTAEELGQSVELVYDAVSFFYSEVRRNLIDMSGPNIQIENLGSFKAKANELPKLVAKYKKNLEVLKPETFNQMQMKKNLETRLEKVLSLQQKMNDEKRRKAKFIEQKYARKANQNMEKS